MKLYIYERNEQHRSENYYVFAEREKMEESEEYRFLGCASSDYDVFSILDKNGYDGEYIEYFMRDLRADYGCIAW